MSRRGECERAALHYVAFVSIASTLNLILFLVFGGLCTLLASFAAGRSLLLALPGAFTAGSFSKRGPSEEQLRGTSFTMVHEGYEWSATTKQVSKQPSVRSACILQLSGSTTPAATKSVAGACEKGPAPSRGPHCRVAMH